MIIPYIYRITLYGACTEIRCHTLRLRRLDALFADT